MAPSIEKYFDFSFSPDPRGIKSLEIPSKIAVVTNIGNELIIFDTKSNRVDKRIKTQQESSCLLTIHPSKPLVYVTNKKSGSISVIDLSKEEVIDIISCGSGTEGIDMTPDGKEIWVTNTSDQTISVIETENHKSNKDILCT